MMMRSPRHPSPPALWCFKGASRRLDDSLDSTSDSPEEGRPERQFRCVRCDTALAPIKALFFKNSPDIVQVHANPHGIIHEIVTLREARSLLFLGEPTTEFTWFPGYAWQVAHCITCQGHAGWRFTATSDARSPLVFFGLLRKALRED